MAAQPDTSFYRQQMPSSGDAGEGFMRAFAAGDQVRRNRVADQEHQQNLAKQKAIEDAYKANLVTNPDGSTTLNRAGTLSAIAKVDPMKAMETEKAFNIQDAEDQRRKLESAQRQTEFVARTLGGVTDQNSYATARQQLISSGIAPEKDLPSVWEKRNTDSLMMRALSAKEQLDYQLKSREVGAKEAEARRKGADGSNLPIEAKKTIEGLATKNAGKISIKNQIDAVLGNWDSMTPDQQLIAGRQLIKTLNSTEGADAVGTEESKRLGAKLEFAYGNFNNDNPVQFGRDLSGFKEQAQNVSKAIGGAIAANSDEIDRQYGRTPKPKKQAAKEPPYGQTVTQNGITYSWDPEIGDYR